MSALLTKIGIWLTPIVEHWLVQKATQFFKWLYGITIQKLLDKGATKKFDDVVKKPEATREERRNAEDDFYN